MQNTLPGIATTHMQATDATTFLNSLFTTQGLVLSQVLELTNLSPHTIQNWVKRGFLAPPVGKKYDKNQFCTIVLLNMFGNVFHLDEVRHMIDYVGEVCPETPVLIYTSFASCLAALPEDTISQATELDTLFEKVLKPQKMAKDLHQKTKNVLHILVLAFISRRVKNRAQKLLDAL